MSSCRVTVLGWLLLTTSCRVQVTVGDAPAAGGSSLGGSAPNGGAGPAEGGSGGSGSAGAGGVAGAAAPPPCADPSALLVNGSFEEGASGTPRAWVLESDGASPSWVIEGAASGTRALAISNASDQPSTAVFRQKLTLAPYTPYVLSGWMRFEAPEDLGAPRLLAELSAEPYFLASTGPSNAAAASSDWRRVELDFETGYDGNIEVTGRLNGAGSAYFDDLSIACNTAVRRYESKHFILDLRPDQEAAVGAVAARGVVARSELALLAIAELTGQEPALNGFRQAAFGPKWFEAMNWPAEEPGGAGYPFLWRATPSMFSEGWRRDDYVPESFVLAFAQNFAAPAWNFELAGIPEAHDASGLVAYYAYETLGLASVSPTTRVGADNRERFSKAYTTYWATRRCARSDALAYRDILLSDRLGWAPFRHAYRSVSQATDLTTPWRRVEAFHRALAVHSGRSLSGTEVEVAQDRALFSAAEWEDVRHYYDRSLSAAYPAPAAVEAAVLRLPLSVAAWASAATDWAQPARNTLADGCPLATERAAYAHGLWAHASSSYVFDLGGTWQALEADYGLALGITGGSVRFDVLGDGQLLFSSARITDGDSHELKVSVAGVQRLELRTETPPAADGSVDENSAWGVWLEPTLNR